MGHMPRRKVASYASELPAVADLLPQVVDLAAQWIDVESVRRAADKNPANDGLAVFGETQASWCSHDNGRSGCGRKTFRAILCLQMMGVLLRLGLREDCQFCLRKLSGAVASMPITRR